ncbi:LysR family transcriptional regulator [Gluconacetobacter asukensis]|uniref:LysR family transcriptional regulator n=1 Tax=Gluconacetobacter asukensis TaxID=1017181 RepID=UPI0030841362
MAGLMYLTELRYLLAIIEAGSFGRAARSLHLLVSTLTPSLKVDRGAIHQRHHRRRAR